MEKARLETIKERVDIHKDVAERIMSGERDNYDGADGARYVLELCELAEELIKAISVD